ncbi:MAG: hypothetical protein Q9213_007017 [Squamulea squamosa]
MPLNAQSGGFVQFAKTADASNDKTWQKANIWGPVTTTVLGDTETILALRGQTQIQTKDEGIGRAYPLGCVNWVQGNATRIIGFDCVKISDTTYTVRASVYILKGEQPNPSRQEVDAETARKCPISLESVGQVNLMEKKGSTSMNWANYIRIVSLKSSHSTSSSDIAIALVIFSKDCTSIQIKVASLTVRDGTLISASDKKVFNEIGLCIAVKPFTGVGREPGILLVNFVPEDTSGKTAMVIHHIVLGEGSEWRKQEYRDTFDDTANVSWSILVGNILNLPNQSSQIIALGTAFPQYHLRLYDQNPITNNFNLLSTHTCTSSTKPPLIRHYLTALLPSYPPAKPGLDVLTISLHKNTTTSSYNLLFRTHRRTTSQRTAGASGFTSHDTCFDCTITDDLAPQYHSGAYSNLKWLRSSVRGRGGCPKPAMMEIFSWQGKLGARLFAPPFKAKYGEYRQVGIQLDLGQKSDGCEGVGILPWGDGEEWVDSNSWKFKVNGRDGKGSWGMSEEDSVKSIEGGWDVER